MPDAPAAAKRSWHRLYYALRAQRRERAGRDRARLPARCRASAPRASIAGHIRPYEALGQRVPAEVYRVSARRLSRCSALAGYPDGCSEAKIDRQGWIRCEGLRVYISYALGGCARVWFFRMLLGAFVPGRDTTIQPCAADAVPDEDVATTNSTTDLDTASAA